MTIEYNNIEKDNLKLSETANRLYKILLKWIPFADSTFKKCSYIKDSGHFFGGSYFYSVETAIPMFLYTVVSGYGQYDETITGIPRKDLEEKAIMALKYLCATNEYGPKGIVREKSTNVYANGTKWGAKGEEFFRASAIGRTGVLMAVTALVFRDRIDEKTFKIVEKIVTAFSDRWANELPRVGTYFDTQCEENAWTALGITGGLVLYKEHPHREKWLEGFNRWAINSISTYKDRMNTDEYMGKSLRNFWMKGVTFHPDFTTENHSFIHPEYMAAGIILKAEAAVALLMTGNELPDTITKNNENVYERTIGRWCQDDGLIIPVQGQDWWYTRYHGNHMLHTAMNLFHNKVNSAAYLQKNLEMMEKLQNSHELGTLLEENPDQTIDEYGHYKLKDMEHASVASLVYSFLLHTYLDEPKSVKSMESINTELEGVYEYPFGCTVINRRINSFSSFSWRNKVMAFNLPKNGMWTVTPIVASMTGEVRFNERKLPDSLCNERDIRDSIKNHIDVRQEGFCATARVHRDGGKLIQDISFVSLPDSTTVYSDRFSVGENCETTLFHGGLVGVRNEDIKEFGNLAKGYRDIHTGLESHRYKGYFGGQKDDIDYLPMTGMVNIDDEMGFIYFNSNGVKYINRHVYNAWKGVEDQLVFNNIKDGNFKKGDRTSIFTLVSLPNSSPEETSLVKESAVMYEAKFEGTAALKIKDRLVVCNFNDRDVDAVFEKEYMDELLIYPGETMVVGNKVTRKISIREFRSFWLEPVTRMKIGYDDNIRILSIDGAIVIEDLNSGKIRRLQ